MYKLSVLSSLRPELQVYKNSSRVASSDRQNTKRERKQKVLWQSVYIVNDFLQRHTGQP